MTATYTSPDNNNKDAVRFLIGDTIIAKALLQDEEIQFLLDRWYDEYGTVEYVAAVAAETVGARFAREAQISADGVSVSLANLGNQFRELAVQLRQQHQNLLVGGEPDVGGVSPYEELDPDIRPMNFGKGMQDNPEAGRQDYGSQAWGPLGTYIAEYQPGA